MPTFRFDAIIQSSTGLPEDNIVNTWHFFTASTVIVSDFDNVRDMLKDFYTKVYTLSGSNRLAIAGYIPQFTTAATALVKAYQVGATPGSPPDYSSSFSLGSRSANGPLPAEVALCFSFQGAREDGLNQARNRNRKYIGPFAANALGSTGRPVQGLIDSMTVAGRELIKASDASVTWDLRGNSPSRGVFFEVTDGWVDNAWDTQRRRGPATSARQLFSSSTPPV